MDGQGFGLRLNPPGVGEHTGPLLRALGYSQDELERLAAEGIIVLGETPCDD